MKVTLTPNKRLARALARGEAEKQLADGAQAWRREPILPWSAWMDALLNDYLAHAEVDRLPLSAHQSQIVWLDVVSKDVVIGASGVASLVQQAWSRLHDWLIPDTVDWNRADLTVDSNRFAQWASRYRARLDESGWIDADLWRRHLPGLVAAGKVPLPDEVVLVGFDLGLSPCQNAILRSLEQAGVSVTARPVGSQSASPLVTVGDDRDEEMEMAAAWVRGQLESGAEKIALVVPDLAGRLGEVDRVLRRALRPDVARFSEDVDLPWHVALGAPLSQFPVVAHALDVLALDPDDLSVTRLSALLRSPFFSGWSEEQAGRSWLDFELRRLPGDCVSLGRVLALAPRASEPLNGLIDLLEAWRDSRSKGIDRRLPSSWARQFCDELTAIGYGHGRMLESREFQAWDCYQGVLEQMAALDLVSGPMPRGRAVAVIQDLAGKRLFREQNPGSPVEVMTVPEALGGEFDAVWIVGMDDARWPSPAQPDPFIPRRLQAECPDATADGQLERAKAMVDGLSRVANSVVMSYAAVDGELPMRLSRLVTGQHVDPDAVVDGRWRPFPESAPLAERISDDQAPPVTELKVRGGSRVLLSQASCPFKAVAEHRMGAVSVEDPRPGLDARDRGSMLHYALEDFWRKVESSDALQAMDDEDAAASVRNSAERAVARMTSRNPLVISDRMKALEVERLSARLHAWLEVERQRPSFVVKAIEEPRTLSVGGLELEVKLDRVDETPEGELLIDYKGGNPMPATWFPGDGIADPQLPAYTLTIDGQPAGLAFGKLRPDQVGFAGLSGPELEVPGVIPVSKATRGLFREYSSWQELLGDWRETVTGLAEDFRAGRAEVAPRHPSVCERCELRSLCRLRARMAA